MARFSGIVRTGRLNLKCEVATLFRTATQSDVKTKLVPITLDSRNLR